MPNIDRSFRVKNGISFLDEVGIFYQTIDPITVGYEAPVGSILLRKIGTTNGELYVKVGTLDTDWKRFAVIDELQDGSLDAKFKSVSATSISADSFTGITSAHFTDFIENIQDVMDLTLSAGDNIGLYYDDAGNKLTISGDVTAQTDHVQIYYVGKHGSNGKSGKTVNDAFLTFGRAVAEITSAETPSTSNRFVIMALDGGTYTESFTIPAFVSVVAPGVTVDGQINIAGDTSLKVDRILRNTGFGIDKTGANNCHLDVNEIICTGAATAVRHVGNTTSVLSLAIEKIVVGSGFGLQDVSSGVANITGRIGSIVDSGAGTGIAVDSTNDVTLTVNKINCNTAYRTTSTGRLKLIASTVVGTVAAGANVDAAIADVDQQVYKVEATNSVGGSIGTTWITVPDMTISAATAGDYLMLFNANLTTTTTSEMWVSFFKNGIQIANSQKKFVIHTAADPVLVSLIYYETGLAANDVITVQMRRSTGTATVTGVERIMVLSQGKVTA